MARKINKIDQPVAPEAVLGPEAAKPIEPTVQPQAVSDPQEVIKPILAEPEIQAPVEKPVIKLASAARVKTISKTDNIIVAGQKAAKKVDLKPLAKPVEKKSVTPDIMRHVALFATILFIVVVLAALIQFLASFKGEIKNQGQLNEQEVSLMLSKIAKHIKLPSDERPTISTIQDIQILQSQQPFFKDAHNGDRLIIYSNKAIIYNEKEDILINVGPIYWEAPPSQVPAATTTQETPSSTTQVAEPVKVEIRNGGAPRGSAAAWGEKIKALGGFEVLGTKNASQKYPEGIIIDLKGKDIAKLKGIFTKDPVKEMPSGEVPSEADVLIILGAN